MTGAWHYEPEWLDYEPERPEPYELDHDIDLALERESFDARYGDEIDGNAIYPEPEPDYHDGYGAPAKKPDQLTLFLTLVVNDCVNGESGVMPTD